MCISLGHTSRLERNHIEAPFFSRTGAGLKDEVCGRKCKMKLVERIIASLAYGFVVAIVFSLVGCAIPVLMPLMALGFIPLWIGTSAFIFFFGGRFY